MEDDNKKHNDQFSASLRLPDEPTSSKKSDSVKDSNPAADLIRKKVDAAYDHEPNPQEESEDIKDLGGRLHRSGHQEFIYNLTNSGRPLHEVQTAWHEYYAGLPDNQKHAVWQEFYAAHAQAAHHPAVAQATSPAPKPHRKASVKAVRSAASPKPHAEPKVAGKSAPAKPLHSILFGLGTGSVVILIFLFSFFNERIIAPFIQPSRNVSNIPIISDSAAGGTPEVIIPKINVQIPVIYDVNTIEESAVEKGLERGVVHYADTASPGQNGNVVIVGHSSNNIFNQGKYKFAFVLLSRLDTGDTFYLQKDGKRYTYQIYTKKIVKPDDISVLGLADKPATATLITCDPPGTSTNRLVVTAQQISPDPIANFNAAPQSQLAAATRVIPGNSPSLWYRLTKWFSS